jgi:hypothetical protein
MAYQITRKHYRGAKKKPVKTKVVKRKKVIKRK